MSFFEDDDTRLDYPTADRVVREYLRRSQQRPRTTTVDVLKWSDYPNNQHNRKRVYTALERRCTPTEDNWAGRTVFEL